jgi:hypothetical protein
MDKQTPIVRKIIKILIKSLIMTIKLLFCLFFSLFIGIYALAGLFIKTSIVLNIIYIILTLYIFFGIWVLCFKKTKKLTKIIYVVLFIIYLPMFNAGLDLDSCFDTGICSEGVKLGDKVITKEYCLEKNGIWNDEKRWCTRQLKVARDNCFSRGGCWNSDNNQCEKEGSYECKRDIFDSDYCVEDGDCYEGREIKRHNTLIVINKENCLKYSWNWDEKRRQCKVK